MSKAEILRELPKLALEDRREIFETIGDLEERDLLRGGLPSEDERLLLDQELNDYVDNPAAG